MAVYKCKMCGANLEISPGASVTECEFCGTTQTVPTAKDENLQSLFNRANMLRLKSEFDKAEQLYEKIVAADETQAEAYWGIVLCRYGIEYVEDPKTYKRLPTCHRTLYESVVSDSDYLAALQYADVSQRTIYEKEAAAIDRVQKDILNIVGNEKPFDVFICYKETDENGNRTVDSTIANDIYYELTEEGLKVFYAAITLEDKLGQEYEPYIFAALNTAKVMLVIGTRPEYFEAVWVKNEWSRFLKLMKSDRSKQLFPCYRDMDAYSLPAEFAHLQAQDMSKIGFINDIVRGIKKLITPADTVPAAAPAVTAAVSNTAPLLKRAYIFLEDGDWKSADEYCEKVLDQEPENPEAYLCKLMAELRVHKKEELPDCAEPFDRSTNYSKAVRYADEALANTLKGYVEAIKTRNKNARDEATYSAAAEKMNTAKTEEEFEAAAETFASLPDYKNSNELQRKCREMAVEAHKNAIYSRALELYNSNDFREVAKAKAVFGEIPGFKDADELAASVDEKSETMRKDAFVENCKFGLNDHDIDDMKRAIEGLRAMNGWRGADELADKLEIHMAEVLEEERKAKQAEEERIAREKQERLDAEKRAIAERRNRTIKNVTVKAVIAVVLIGVIATAAALIYNYGFKIPAEKYSSAVAYMENGEYDAAIEVFSDLGRYEDSEEKILECKYLKAGALVDKGELAEACTVYAELAKENYSDSADKRAAIIRVNHHLAEVNDIVVFGTYEQDNDTSNGKEEIEWRVVAKDESGLTVISNSALDYRPYAEKSNGYHVNWSDCSLRKWLNSTFIAAAFSAEEQTKLVAYERITPHNNDDEDDVTSDKVFLLSLDDEEYELPEDETVKASQYAMSLFEQDDSLYSGDAENLKYWLREPNGGAGADLYGKYGQSSRWTYENAFIRPAVRITFE